MRPEGPVLMANLYVPLDVNYAEDDKIVDAGPMAELLYVRSLAFAKRARTNGHIRESQLSIVAARIPRARALAARLVDVHLWERDDSGLYIRAWLKRNLPVDEIAAAKSAAGALGNHRRWHLPPDGQPNPECAHCRKEGLA
jgi:hypothetical protein